MKLSDETKAKISVAHKGKRLSEEHKAKVSDANKDKPKSEKTKKKLSDSMKGNKNGVGVKKSDEERYRMSERVKGENNPSWKGGVSSENERLRKSSKYAEWRKSVFERDNYTCRDCGKHGVELNAHHLLPLADCREFATYIINGVTLCIECHKKYHSSI